jgi:hypothetical protein
MAPKDISPQVQLTIFNPYETFTPRPVTAELVDLSMKSARLITYDLTRSECELLKEERMLSKITISATFLRQPLTLKADIFWVNFVLRDMTEQPYSDLGFNLRQPTPAEERDLRMLVEHWSRRSARK